jgi:hypothetical protein
MHHPDRYGAALGDDHLGDRGRMRSISPISIIK